MKLSIIIPYYNVKKYTDELLSVLDPQITDQVEVLLIDDGSVEPFTSDYPWLTVIWQKHGGPSKARNAGLNIAIGEYVAFIDADDIVAKDYIQNILEHIKSGADYIELSWKSLTPDGMQFNHRVTNTQALKNPSVCTRVFKRSFIGMHRFNELKDAGEDEDFTRHLDISRGSRDFISSYMYFYRTNVIDSRSKKYHKGIGRTKQIVYHIPVVKADNKKLLKEIKEADKQHEVFLLCNENHIPELSKYCQISPPRRIWAHELRGEPCNMVTIEKQPIKTQVVIYINGSSGHDGITTFIYNFCKQMHEYYDIIVLHEFLSGSVINRLRPFIQVVKRGDYPLIYCDTLLLMRIADNIPDDVEYKNLYQIVHCTKSDTRILKRDPANCIFVSETSRKSFTDKGRVIHNIGNPDNPQKTLILMSTSRIGANDKGDQDIYMLQFADHLNRNGVNFLWFYFSVNSLHGAPSNMIRLDPVDDVRGYLTHADYLVHLSENEAYCYSITEALSVGVPVIVFDIPILQELGFCDEIDGYIIPKDMNIDVNIILNAPRFKGFNVEDDVQIREQWRDLLGDTTPQHDYVPEKMVTVKVKRTYMDVEQNRTLTAGEHMEAWRDRAEHLKSLGLVEIIGG